MITATRRVFGKFGIMSYQLFLLLIFLLPNQTKACNGEIWQPPLANSTRDDLLCSCNKDAEDYDGCCRCHSCAVWEGREIDLYIEYVSVSGRNLVLSDQASNETEVYKIEHTDSEMTEIPSNLCHWDNERNLEEKYPSMFKNMQQFWGSIVKINFENNKIRKLPDINCLNRLDELNLRHNRLVYLSNTSFIELTHLRSIDFSGNIIKVMDPGILISEQLSVLHADLSYNQLEKLDVSNMASSYPFCSISYKSNKITELVNEGNFTFNLSKAYGPGFVSCNDNKISTWPDFECLLNLKDISQLGHLFSFGFDFRNIPLVCDCNIERFMSKAYDVINPIYLDYMNVTCTAPPDLDGISVINVDPARLICPVDDGCDPRCKCVDKPNKRTLFIDCQNSDLEVLPDIPDSRYSPYVSLNISGSQVKQIGNCSYLSRISVLDVSNNNLLELDSDTIKLLENATYIDISNNPNLRQLPRTFQYHNICSRHMRNLQISCDCNSLWIEQWLKSKDCVSQSNLFECVLPQAGEKPALSFQKSDLECSPNQFSFFLETIIAGAILVLLIITIPIYIFRYEILILYLRARQIRKGNSVLPLHKYDVFLSFNDTDDTVNDWVYLTLEPQLAKAGYRVFEPSRDVAFGAERDTEIISILAKTGNFLTILSDSYLTQADEGMTEADKGMRSWTENEWKYGWNNFKADRSKNIVMVNFDHVSSFDVEHPQIKAFLRVGCTVDFKNQNRQIMEDIYRKLGKPFKMPRPSEKAFDNKNKKNSTNELFTVDCTDKRVHLTGNDREQENIDIITKFHTCDADISNVFKRLNGQKHQKTCQFRKCYACNRGLEIIPNTNISKAYRNSTSRFKPFNQISSINKLDGSQDKLSTSNHSLIEERHESTTIFEDQHENTTISEDNHENNTMSKDKHESTIISEDKHENTTLSKDKVGYLLADNMHSFPDTEEAPGNISMHAQVPQDTLVTDSKPIQYTKFPENPCVTDFDPKGRPEKLEGSADEMIDFNNDISVTRNTANLHCLRNSRQCFLQENSSEIRSSASSRASVSLGSVSVSDFFV